MRKLNVLVIEDERAACTVMAPLFEGHSVEFAHDEVEARKLLAATAPDLCLIDLQLGRRDLECSGFNLIPLSKGKGAYSVVMSSRESKEHVEKAFALGCDDFYAKGEVRAKIGKILARCVGRDPEDQRLLNEQFVTQDSDTRSQISEALEYARTDLSILLLGPSGTGKTTLAQLLHERSRREGQFVGINCSAYSPDILELELFGSKRGAFTGATDRGGKLLAANGGTLFLDEIGAMNGEMQTKLLKALEERVFYPLGNDELQTSNFRVISATHEDLPALVKSGRMRFDFFQRIHGFTVKLKPLAERQADILPILERMTQGERKLLITPGAEHRLLRHPWPGNARELRKFVDLASAGTSGRISEEIAATLLAKLTLDSPKSFLTPEQYRYAKDFGLRATMRRLADEAIRRSMAEHKDQVSKVLKDLKTNSRTLYDALRRIGARKEGSIGE